MKFVFIALSLLISTQVFARDLICESENYKFGLSSDSNELFVGRTDVSDEDLFTKSHEHGRVSIAYNAELDQFSGSGEDGCTQVEYVTVKDAQGFVTLLENAEGVETSYVCRAI